MEPITSERRIIGRVMRSEAVKITAMAHSVISREITEKRTMTGRTAVSYTHLDVYKRQAHGLPELAEYQDKRPVLLLGIPLDLIFSEEAANVVQ